MKNIRFFLFENFQFLEVEFSIYSNRNVFVMLYKHVYVMKGILSVGLSYY